MPQIRRRKQAILPLEEAFARAERFDIYRQRDTLKWLAWAYMSEERWDEVVAVAEKRLSLPPHEVWGDRLRDMAHGWMGEAALYRGDYTTAVKQFKAATRMHEQAREDVDSSKEILGRMFDAGIVGHYLVDLGITYDKMGRPGQASAMFRKAIPHVELALSEKIAMREKCNGMRRREGRRHMDLAWVLEKTEGISHPRVLEEYRLAEMMFRKTTFVEDDFVEFGDTAAAEEAINRVEAGQPYTYPEDSTFRGERMRLKIGSERPDWSNDRYKEDSHTPRRRGRSTQ